MSYYIESIPFRGANAVYSIVTIGKAVMFIHIPVHFMLNRYGHAALNDWDGNSVSIDAEGENGNSIILAPQIGAGEKNKNTNTFTGILMGSVKQTNSTKTQNGLFGYSSGARSIFLDADTGKAEFGKMGSGQIIIDPSNNDAILKSGNFSTSDKKGMQIDLSKPSIEFGSGHFKVDEKGNITAEDGGKIAGWNIGTNALTKDKVGISSNSATGTNIAFWAGNSNSSNAPFSVNYNGLLKAYQATIGNGTNKITIGGSGSNSSIYSGSHSTLSSSENGFYLGTDGLSIGSNFSVTNTGVITAKSGYIGNGTSGFTITNSAIYNGKNSRGGTDKDGIYLGTDGIGLGKGKFYVTNTGVLHAQSGDVAGWVIEGDGIKSKEKLKYSDSDGIYFGKAGIRLGSSFHVNDSGKLYAVMGEIGGWYITSSGLYDAEKQTDRKVSLKPTELILGNFKVTNAGQIGQTNKESKWSITKEGKATFANINITGGTMTGATITGGSRTGGSITGGSIGSGTRGVNFDPNGIGIGNTKKNLGDWVVDELIAKTVTADYITSAFTSSVNITVGSLTASSFTLGKLGSTNIGGEAGKTGTKAGIRFRDGFAVDISAGDIDAKKLDGQYASYYAKASAVPSESDSVTVVTGVTATGTDSEGKPVTINIDTTTKTFTYYHK